MDTILPNINTNQLKKTTYSENNNNQYGYAPMNNLNVSGIPNQYGYNPVNKFQDISSYAERMRTLNQVNRRVSNNYNNNF